MSAFPVPPSPPALRRRYAIVGLGSRHELYQDAIETTHREWAQLVGVCDINPGRVEVARRRSGHNGAPTPPGYIAGDFRRMLVETRPDIVIVVTVDAFHHEYLIAAMEAGCDVVTEKPMTTNADACRSILETRRRTGRSCRVTFNYRYTPPRAQVKELLMSGVIGDILSVDFQWLLNTHHGADYFRRWHSEKKNSGGLLVHKSTHHFDLVNWWLSAMPVAVQASGKREFYTPAMARRLGLQGPHERCLTCPEADRCGFHLDLRASASHRELYLEQEKYDGYLRDRCVFRPEINIEDTLNVMVSYDTGATLSYSLNAFNSWEGYMVAFNGTQGRLEHTIVESVYINGATAIQGGIAAEGVTTRLIPLRGAAQEITPWPGAGDHGGGDKLLLDDLFLPAPPADKFLRAADERAGALSILVGVAANESLVTRREVRIADLVPDLQRPDFPAMPNRVSPLQMPGMPPRNILPSAALPTPAILASSI